MCLTRFAEDEASASQGRCPSCFQCPRCETLLVACPLASSGTVALACGACAWRSDVECSIIGTDKSDIQFQMAAVERERHDGVTGTFKEILELHQMLVGEVDKVSPEKANPSVTDLPVSTSIFPKRAVLLTKKTLRCRQALSSGKLSILVQPKPFPLEGDSSLKIQRGKWWTKDSSIIHDIPSFVIHRLPKVVDVGRGDHVTSTQGALQFSVYNPRDIAVKVKLSFTKQTSLESERASLYQLSPAAGYVDLLSDDDLDFSLGPYEDELLRIEDGEGAGLEYPDASTHAVTMQHPNLAVITLPISGLRSGDPSSPDTISPTDVPVCKAFALIAVLSIAEVATTGELRERRPIIMRLTIPG
jgi:hypothetical protein